MIPPFRREFDAARDPITAQYALNLGKPAIWTPTLTFATPGDLSVTYLTRNGTIISIGPLRIATFRIQTSAFTFTTASGNCQITGLPIAATSAIDFTGPLGMWNGITKAGFTDIGTFLSGSTILLFANASGTTTSSVKASDMPTGGTVILRGQVIYHIS